MNTSSCLRIAEQPIVKVQPMESAHSVKSFDLSEEHNIVPLVDHILRLISQGYSAVLKNDMDTDLLYVDSFTWRRGI